MPESSCVKHLGCQLSAVGMALALAACAPQPAETGLADGSDEPAALASGSAAAGPPEAVPAGVPLPSPPGLAGEWRVAGIDGQAFDEPYAIALSGDGRELWWTPRCAGMIRSYRIKGTEISFGPPLGFTPPPPGAPPVPVCAIGLPPRLKDVVRAIDSATAIVRTASNGVELSGGGHRLVLYAQ